MPENFPAGQFLRKADKCLGVCIVNKSMIRIKSGYRSTTLGLQILVFLESLTSVPFFAEFAQVVSEFKSLPN